MTAVMATDKDQSKTNNGTFDLKIVSITPTPPDNLEFFLEQSGPTGIIKFKGCLEHDVRGVSIYVYNLSFINFQL